MAAKKVKEIVTIKKPRGSKKLRPASDPRLARALQLVGGWREWRWRLWLADRLPRLLEMGAGLLACSIIVLLFSTAVGKPLFYLGWLLVLGDLFLHPAF